MFIAAARGIAEALFGGRCYLCRGTARGGLLCPGCDGDLPRLPAERCPCCALPSTGGRTCGRCLAQDPAYDSTEAAIAFAFPADVLVHALKYRGELALAPLLASLLAPRIAHDHAIAAVVPVPLSAARLRERGFNQAMEIARPLAAIAGAPLQPGWLERSTDTPALAGLALADRAKSVRGAFRCTAAVAGLSIAVVDDVMTSGATLEEVARTLKRAGAARVVNWVVARTLPHADA
jgi:ComF family protein